MHSAASADSDLDSAEVVVDFADEADFVVDYLVADSADFLVVAADSAEENLVYSASAHLVDSVADEADFADDFDLDYSDEDRKHYLDSADFLVVSENFLVVFVVDSAAHFLADLLADFRRQVENIMQRNADELLAEDSVYTRNREHPAVRYWFFNAAAGAWDLDLEQPFLVNP